MARIMRSPFERSAPAAAREPRAPAGTTTPHRNGRADSFDEF
jgi:hypothetical protein